MQEATKPPQSMAWAPQSISLCCLCSAHIQGPGAMVSEGLLRPQWQLGHRHAFKLRLTLPVVFSVFELLLF